VKLTLLRKSRTAALDQHSAPGRGKAVRRGDIRENFSTDLQRDEARPLR
jgi:hypothetical protein